MRPTRPASPWWNLVFGTAVALLLIALGRAWVGPRATGGTIAVDLLLPFLVYVAMARGAGWGAGIGFLLGLVEDLLGTGLLGMNAFSKSLSGFVVGLSSSLVVVDSMAVQALGAVFATVLQGLATWSLAWAFDQAYDPGVLQFVTEPVFNGLVALLLLPLLRRAGFLVRRA